MVNFKLFNEHEHYSLVSLPKLSMIGSCVPGRVLLSVVLSVLCVHSYSQSGPAGVGNNSNNVLWLKADQMLGIYTNSQTLSEWKDVSGNENHLFQSTVSQQPLFRTTIINNQPSVEFDFNNNSGQNDFMWGGDSSNLDNSSGLSIFTVIRPTSTGSARSIIAKRINVGIDQSYMLFFFNSNYLYADIVGNNDRFNSSPIAFPTNNNYIISMLYDGSLPSSSRSKLYSGQNLMVTAAESNTSIPDYNSPLIIGSTHIGDNRAFGGYISEIIIFNEALNSTQKLIVDNYLSSKYNIPLNSGDIYSMDDAAMGDYDHEMAGIGKISNTDRHEQAKGSSIVSILNPTNLDNNEFLLWAHNNLEEVASNRSDVPMGIQARLQRTWRVSEVNLSGGAVNVGNIDIHWDLSEFDSIQASDLRLLIDTDNDGAFMDESPIAGAIKVSGSTYAFTAISNLSNANRFTLGSINTSQTPLPVEWDYFNLSLIDEKNVKLEWKTLSEINNDYFEVQRSTDLLAWTTLTKIKGAGNSQQTHSYTYLDNQAMMGDNYYRIKQVDFNGKWEYSEIKSKKLEHSSDFIFYPNPVKNLLIMESQLSSDFDQLRLFNILGKEVQNINTINFEEKNKLIIDMSQLPNGIYYLQTKKNFYKLLKI